MTEFINLIGYIFERLTVVERLANCPKGSAVWLCQCSCGSEKAITAKSTSLKLGHTKSCGCLKIEKSKERLTKHGLRSHSLYHTWLNMRDRCNNSRNKNYPLYGGKGIEVCREWEDFATFLVDMGEKPAKEYSLERIDGSKNYNKTNCKWATASEQARNTGKRSNNLSGVTGVHLTRIHGIPYWTATWVGLDGKEQRRRFNAIILGDTEAYKAACQCRLSELKRLNEAGGGYSERHGK